MIRWRGAATWGDTVNRQFIRSPGLTGLKEVADQFGGDLKAALQQVGLDPAVLRQGDAQVDFTTYCQLLENCAVTWRLPDLAFRMVPYQHLEILGPVALVTRMEPTLRDALYSIVQNLTVYTNALVAALEEQEDVAAVIVSVQNLPVVTRQYIFLTLAVTKNIIDQAAGRPLTYIEASFREPQLGLARTAEAWFGCPVRFGAERDALYFNREALDLRLERSDTAYHAIIRRYLSTEREATSGSVVDATRQEIARQMELGHCTLESVAHARRLEPRSLQRRLKEENSSFRELIDDWRRKRAMSLVTLTRKPLSDVADALGYAHQAVFTRAFLRWYGQSPLVYRKQAAALANLPDGRIMPSANIAS